jgi:hypothetical protein
MRSPEPGAPAAPAAPTAPASAPSAPAPPAAPVVPAAPAPPAAAPSPAPPADWRAGLPDDLRGAKSLERYKDLPAALRGQLELERTLGTPLSPPAADARPEEIARYRERIGVPATAEGYELTLPEMPGGPGWAPDAKQQLGEIFQRAGVPKSAAPELVKAFAGYQTQQQQAMRQNFQQAIDRTRAEWGEPVFMQRAHWAMQAARQFGGPPLLDFLEATGLGDHPLLFDTFWKVGQQLAESGVIDGQVRGVPTRDEARAKLDRIMGDKAHPYHKGDAAATDEVLGLQRLLVGDAPVVTFPTA